MHIYNLFEQFDEMEKKARAEARDATLMLTMAKAQGAHPLTLKALDQTIQYCREELANLKHLRNTTKVKNAIVVECRGGSC